MADLSAYLAHIVSQTRQNIDFLISQYKISPTDGSDMLAKLPSLNDDSLLDVSIETHALGISPLHFNPKPHTFTTTAESSSHSEAPTQPPTVQARALWDYKNEENTSDLSFQAGDIIEIVAESHRDWWSGRNLTPGFFPSNYVEKIAAAVAVASPSSQSPLPSLSSSPSPHSQTVLRSSPPQIEVAASLPPTSSPPSHVAPIRSTSGPRPSQGPSHASVVVSCQPRGLPKAPLALGR